MGRCGRWVMTFAYSVVSFCLSHCVGVLVCVGVCVRGCVGVGAWAHGCAAVTYNEVTWFERVRETLFKFKDICPFSRPAGFRDAVDQLLALSHDFLSVATTYGKIIVSEHFLPDFQKTIQPLDMGGAAGGLKFAIHDVSR